MNRRDFTTHIRKTYNIQPDFPWFQHPNYGVFRHGGNKKWFAVIMDIPGVKLGLPSEETIDVVNLKCTPELMGGFLMEPGIFPAYHMNKNNWLSKALDSADHEKLQILLDMSFQLTKPKTRISK